MPKKIAILTNVIHPYRLPVLEELRQRWEGLEVFVASTDDSSKEKNRSDSQLKICQQKTWTWRTKWKHPHDFTESLAIQIPYDTIFQLRRFQPDLIVSGELGPRTVLAAAYRRFCPSTRLVIWATLSEATEQGRGWFRPLLRWLVLRAADAVIVNGESGARYIQRFGVTADRIRRVPQAPDAAAFLSGQLDRPHPARHRLLYSGRLVELKGLQPFLGVLAEWAVSHCDRRVEFWIAGDGPLRSELSSFATPPNLEIRMMGHVTYDRLPEIYSQCGILAFPSLADEWGMVVVEAMASGMPVLGSIQSQAVDELVSDRETGWKFNPNDPQDVHVAVTQALAAPIRTVNEMGRKARERVRDITPAAMAAQIEAAMNYAIGHRS